MNDQVTPEASQVSPPGAEAPTERAGDDLSAPAATGQPYLHDLVSSVFAPAMALSGRDGQVRRGGAQGLYVRDIRALSGIVLSVGGVEPVNLHYELVGGAENEFRSVVGGPKEGDPDPKLLVLRHREVLAWGMVEHISVRSYEPRAMRCRVELVLSCDFAGMAAVKGGMATLPQPAGALEGGLTWEIPDRCSTRATGSPRPDTVDAAQGLLAWDIEIPPRGVTTVSLSVEFREDAANAPVEAPPSGRAEFQAPEVVAADSRIAKWVEVSMADLARLRLVAPGHPADVFLAAGAPWYLTLFGRDSLWAARMLLPLGTELALGTLSALARRQGRSDNLRTGEQPGKIPHELRRDNAYDIDAMGRRERNYFSLPPVYYGTVDATPLWVCLLHDAWLWGAPEERVEALLAPMTRCLEWTAGSGRDHRGFLSYIDASGHGLANQGWKDSADAVQYKDGQLAKGPVALSEVQGYAYEAAMGGAELLDAFGVPGGDRWRAFAQDLAKRFRASFWVEDANGPYPAIALDGSGAPVDSLTSNIAHLLGTGILRADESELVARRLGQPDLASGFGLRTLAASSAGFNPVSYHCGSVWAHDTAIAIAGLARAHAPSSERAVTTLSEGLLAAAESFGYRVPELYGGDDRRTSTGPVPYPASCHPQAWTAAASVATLTSLLGLEPDVPRRFVRVAPNSSTGTCLRSVDGISIAGSKVKVELPGPADDFADGARLIGLPDGIKVAGTSPKG
jgi:glycogen debranching enzyme